MCRSQSRIHPRPPSLACSCRPKGSRVACRPTAQQLNFNAIVLYENIAEQSVGGGRRGGRGGRGHTGTA